AGTAPSIPTFLNAFKLTSFQEMPLRRWFLAGPGGPVAHTDTGTTLNHFSGCFVFVGRSRRDVNRRKQVEHVRLDKSHKDVERHEYYGNDQFGQPEEHVGDLLACEHVSIKTNSERKRPDEDADQLDWHHEQNHREVGQRIRKSDRAGKV